MSISLLLGQQAKQIGACICLCVCSNITSVCPCGQKATSCISSHPTYHRAVFDNAFEELSVHHSGLLTLLFLGHLSNAAHYAVNA